ncbi:MAG: Ig-like domain-containing protein, partial [Gammaproteobacteria bacterium]|nr:Ig-like domain-containing protein [Gammaproteobacteria bacterium]
MKNAIKSLGVSFGIVLLAALWAPTASAFPTYSCDGTGEDGSQQILCFDGADGTNPDSGNCANCHGGFREGGYVSNTADDPAAWGIELMNGHVNAYGLACRDCHTGTGNPRTPTFLDAADGGITCSNCHGRDEDITPNDGAFGGPGPGRSDGLRAHHASAGITSCADCHTADTTPVGEHIPSPTFVTLGIDPCNEDGGDLTITGNFGNVGLDNDGDALREPDDPDCAVNVPPVAVDDTASTPFETPVTIPVLVNDIDDDGPNALTVDSVTQGANGGVVNNGGDVTYTPALGFSGTDTFTYTATDGADPSNVA